MDMFPDTALVRVIQQQLDDIIQQGVRNITRLIRATDPAGADPLGRGAAAASPRGPRLGAVPLERQGGSLASRLVKDGLLTPDLLRQLQSEWFKEVVPKGQEVARKNKKK